jgi:hypothetical protein
MTEDRDDRIGRSLRALGEVPEAPPPGPALQAELGRITPVRTRRPRRQFAAVSAISLAGGGLLLLLTQIRPDLARLPMPWLVLYCAAWLASFLVITWLALVPGPRRVMPSWQHAGIGAVVASLGFVLAGLLFDRHAPGSVVREATLHDLLHGSKCLLLGGVTALVPVAVSALLLRGSIPVGSRWAGAGVGAGGGSLGGLILHLHCPVADALHLGVIHGGLVVIGAVVGALAVPRIARA